MTNLMIKSKDFYVTDGIRNYITKKLQKANAFLDNEVINVTLSNEQKDRKIQKRIQVMTTYLSEIIIVDEIDEDLYIAIDKVEEKLIKSLRRRKDKVKNAKKNLGYNLELNSIEKEEKKSFYEDDEAIRSKIVKHKQFNLKPMFVEEAVLQMDLLKHAFFLFLNAETETMCVVYRRKDGNYGYIEGIV